MVDVTTFPGSSMTARNVLLVLTCAVGFILARSLIVFIDRLKRADLLAGLPFLFLSAQLCPCTTQACRSVRRITLLCLSCFFQLNSVRVPLKRAGLSAGLPCCVFHHDLVRRSPAACRSVRRDPFLVQLDLVRRSPEACLSVRRASFSSCTLFQCRSTRLTFGSKFLA